MNWRMALTLRRRPRIHIGSLVDSSLGALLGLAFALALSVVGPASADEARDAAPDPVLEARMMQVAAELRCLVCQNQTIADSHAGLAVDLRREIRSMLAQGKTDAEVLRFMTERYGDFVLYRPPVDARTWLLWFGPLALLGLAATGLGLHLRARAQRPATDFEADPDDNDETTDSDKTPPRQGVTP